jgi:hypothetical protein
MVAILGAAVLMGDFRPLPSEISLGRPLKYKILEILTFGRFFSRGFVTVI